MKCRVPLIICLTIAIAGATLDLRSASRSDIAGFTLADGYGVGVATHTGRLIVLVAQSNELSTSWSLHATTTEHTLVGDAEHFLHNWAKRRWASDLLGVSVAIDGDLSTSTDPRVARPKDLNATLSIPLWLATAIALSPLLALTLVEHRRRRRQLACCCANCGYDLRATPQRCPECGTAAPAR